MIPIPQFSPKNSLAGVVAGLFQNNEPGVWYDPSDMTTLFQDAAGTTPVTAVEQPVGLMLDKSKGLVLGPELVTNGDFSQGETGWSVPANVTFANSTAVFTAVANGSNLNRNCNTVAGRFYQITFTIVSISAGGFQPMVGGAVGTTRTTPGTYTELVTAGAATTFTGVKVFSGVTTAVIDNISVRELPGNHAYQSVSSTSRPVLSARVNRSVSTEDFSLVGQWATFISGTGLVPVRTANAGVSPVGTNTATRIQLALNGGTTIGDFSGIAQDTTQTGTWLVGSTVTSSVWVKTFDGSTQTIRFDANGFSGGTYQITGEWKKLSFNWTVDTANRIGFVLRLRGAQGTSDAVDILIWGADLRVANTGVNLPPYQRVNTATDYDTVGFPHYLRFIDDDWLVTNTITPGIDKAQVFAGVRKLSDEAGGTSVVELSSNASSLNGAFAFFAPFASSTNYAFRQRGTLSVLASSSPIPAPTTNTLTGIGDISGDSAILRVNGTQAASSTADQGTGNYLAYPLYIGRRGGTTLPFNGHLYSLIVRFGANLEESKITEVEKYLNYKTLAFDYRDVTDSSSFRWNSATASPDAE